VICLDVDDLKRAKGSDGEVKKISEKPKKEKVLVRKNKVIESDSEGEWDGEDGVNLPKESGKGATSPSGSSAAGEDDDSFVVEESDDMESESDSDGLFNSDSEEDVSSKRTKSTPGSSRPPLSKAKPSTATSSAKKPLSAPSTATKSGSASNRANLTVTPDLKSISGNSIGSGGSRSGASPFFNTPSDAYGSFSAGKSVTPGSAGSDLQQHQSSTGTPLILPEGVVGRGSHEHNAFPFLLPANRKDSAGLRPGQEGYNYRTLYVPPKFMQDQTPAMMQWWQFKAVNMDTVLFFKVRLILELFILRIFFISMPCCIQKFP
jgi:hypothetical protein